MLWVAVGLVLLTMALWVGVLITQLHAQDIVGQTASRGPLPRSFGVALYNVLSNLAYFGGAVLIGQMSWRAALQRDRSAQQMIWRAMRDRKSTRLNSSHVSISYAVFCLKNTDQCQQPTAT